MSADAHNSSFLSNEAGAVTVDWVVLTAATVGLGLAAMSVVSSGVEDTSSDISNEMKYVAIKSSFGLQYDAFNQNTVDSLYDIYTTRDGEGGSNRTEGDLISSELSWRNAAMDFIDAGSINNARALMDRAAGLTLAGEERGVTLDASGPTHAELEAAYIAEFGQLW